MRPPAPTPSWPRRTTRRGQVRRGPWLLPCRSSRLLRAGGLEVFVEIVEHGGAARQPLLVLAMRRGDARHQGADAGRFLAAVLAVLQVDVVDDLADGGERGIVEAATLQQDLEGAAVALVGVLALEHVEA